MDPRASARRKFIKDLTRTRHMTTVSAVILATTFMPLLGIPDVQELRAFQGAVEGFTDARAHVLAPRRNDEAARERSARAVTESDARVRRSSARNYRTLTVERPTREPIEAERALIPPLPPMEAPEPIMPIEQEAAPVAEVEENNPAPAVLQSEVPMSEEPAPQPEPVEEPLPDEEPT